MFARDGNLTAVPFDLATGRVTGEPSAVGGSVAVGIAAPCSGATPDHSRILIRVSPEAAKDKGEVRLLFGWQDALRPGRQRPTLSVGIGPVASRRA